MQNYKGFTLLELMVTVAIAAVIMSIAVPASKDLQAKIRVNSTANELADALKNARSDAVTARQSISFTQVASASSWASGWQATMILNGVTSTRQVNSSLPVTITIAVNPTTQTAVRFEALTGMVQNVDGTALSGTGVTFTVCDSNSANEVGKDIQVNQFGRIFLRSHTSRSVCNP